MAGYDGLFLAKPLMPHGWEWAGATLMTIFWLFVFAALVYFASKLGMKRWPTRSQRRSR